MSFRGGGGGRERFRRFEDRGSSGQSDVYRPPSRHLWVGNLSHSLSEGELVRPFLRFGDLDSVAFQPGRSYAFINFKDDEGGIAAMKALQGFPLAGNPLRIEFTKDKSSGPSRDEDYVERHDELRSSLRASPLSQKDSRTRHRSPDPFQSDKSKTADKSTEPSEVLWIGFPAQLKVDETILRKAFSPFGDIEKITAFPGRSYAFVRFCDVRSALRAKDTLQGKLFGNPRVHICFAKNEAGSSSSGRSSMAAPSSPRFKSNGRRSSSGSIWQDGNFDDLREHPSIRPPRFISNMEPEDPDVYNFNRKGVVGVGGSTSFEQRRFAAEGAEFGLQHDSSKFHDSPMRERVARLPYHSQTFTQKGSMYEEDPWDLPEEIDVFPEAKRLKTSVFLPENELPEYPLSDLKHENQAFPRGFPDFVQPEPIHQQIESGHFGYGKMPDHPGDLAIFHGDRGGRWRGSHDLQGSPPSGSMERKRIVEESNQLSLKDWKWEGTLAKGGTSICRARCFPVGKVPDIMLPGFLDCTARTSLDMLAKHYYQASDAWVVFFVPGTDNDIGFYNEFMHYLEEKQRAAVAKLDERTTMFLVPPSHFSENVLKVPGKLSISGVALRLEHSGPRSAVDEMKHANLSTINGDDASYIKSSLPAFPDQTKPGSSNLSYSVNVAASIPSASYAGSTQATVRKHDFYKENRHEYQAQQPNPTLLPAPAISHYSTSSTNSNRPTQSKLSDIAVDPTIKKHQAASRGIHIAPNSVNHAGGVSGLSPAAGNSMPLQETRSSVQSSSPLAALSPEQLAQLASTLFGQQRQSANSTPNIPRGDESLHRNPSNQSDVQYRTSESYALQNVRSNSELSTSHSIGIQQLQQQMQANVHGTSTIPPMELQVSTQGGQQQPMPSASAQDAETDPQKRLQATLQLAAALLQQIQQGKGN